MKATASLGIAARPVWRTEIAKNELLAALPLRDVRRMRESLELVDLVPGQVLCGDGRLQSCAYFPTSATVAIGSKLEAGGAFKLAIVGQEGLIGIALFLGDTQAQGYAKVQGAGQAFRINAQSVIDEIHAGGALLQSALRYAQAFMVQLMQAAACQRHHTIEQRTCRWLLQTYDRAGCNEIDISQIEMSERLGVRRSSVSQVAVMLQGQGAIEYARGHITLLDRTVIEKLTCECYARGKADVDRLLHHRQTAATSSRSGGRRNLH